MNKEVESETKVELIEMDDYQKAAAYLMDKALATGDGFMLRAIKTLMDRVAPGG